jgi:predicted enzyme related to lactoylglutathione lyase
MANPVVYWELMGADGDALQAFYASLFDWKLESVPGFDSYYTVDDEAVGGVGGGVGKGPENSPSYLTIYIEVPSIDAHLTRIEEAGGTTVTPRTVIPEIVTFAMFADPAGNLVGLVEGSGTD